MITGKIGVILATYNGEKFIEEQLQSILNQTIIPDEIIISDAGSTDKTVKICKSLLEHHDNVSAKFILHDSIVPVTRNFECALEESTADYIFFCDQDDVWKREKIEVVIKKLISENAIMAFTDAYVVDESLQGNTSLWDVLNYRNNGTVYLKNDSSFINRLIKSNVVAGMCLCIDASLKEQVLPFSENSLHDAWIAFVSILYGNVIAIKEQMTYYRQHSNNEVGAKPLASQSLRQSNVEKRIDFIEKRKKLFEDVLKCINSNDTKNWKIVQEAVSFYSNRIKYMRGGDIYEYIRRKKVI